MNYLTESGLYHLLRILKNWIQDKIINNLTNQIINLSKIENQHYNQLLNKKIDFYYGISTPIPFGFNNFKRNTYFKGINIPTINPNSLVHIIIYTTKYHTSAYYPNYTIWQGTSKEIIDNINNLSKLNDVFSKQYVKVSITSSGELKFEIRISDLEMTFTHIDGVTSYVQIAKEFLPQHIDWNESYYKNGAHIKNKPFGYLPIITHKSGVYSIIGDTVKIHKNNTSYDLKLTPYENINIGEAGRSILLYLSDNELHITNDTNLNTIEIEIPNIKQIDEQFIPNTIARTTDINYDFYKQLTSEFNKSGYTTIQYKKAQVFDYEPFIISTTGETIIPDSFLNDEGTDFFVDCYWKYAFIAGGIPIKTISCDDTGKPSKLAPIYDSSQTYTIDFANKKIIKD